MSHTIIVLILATLLGGISCISGSGNSVSPQASPMIQAFVATASIRGYKSYTLFPGSICVLQGAECALDMTPQNTVKLHVGNNLPLLLVLPASDPNERFIPRSDWKAEEETTAARAVSKLPGEVIRQIQKTDIRDVDSMVRTANDLLRDPITLFVGDCTDGGTVAVAMRLSSEQRIGLQHAVDLAELRKNASRPASSTE